MFVNDAQGAAARAGIRKGDVILAVNNQDVKSVEHLRELMNAVEKGRIVALLIRRGGNSLYIPFRVEGKQLRRSRTSATLFRRALTARAAASAAPWNSPSTAASPATCARSCSRACGRCRRSTPST